MSSGHVKLFMLAYNRLMNIHFLRNATLIIESGEQYILVDPMLGLPKSLPPYAFFRHKPRRNPLVSLPQGSDLLLEKVTAVLITHCRRGHFDHLDNAGAKFIAGKKLPVYCNQLDVAYLQKKGLDTRPMHIERSWEFLGGTITLFPTEHGYGLIGKMMGPGLGYFIELPNEPTLYISGDTVLTAVVRQVLAEQKPDVAVIAAGTARLDIGKPILMPLEEMMEFIKLAPGKVIATHMEALNHCPTTREELRETAVNALVAHKLIIPQDGETIDV